MKNIFMSLQTKTNRRLDFTTRSVADHNLSDTLSKTKQPRFILPGLFYKGFIVPHTPGLHSSAQRCANQNTSETHTLTLQDKTNLYVTKQLSPLTRGLRNYSFNASLYGLLLRYSRHVLPLTTRRINRTIPHYATRYKPAPLFVQRGAF